GVDVFAPLGTPIRAPFDGVATSSASWMAGLDLTVTGRAGFVFNAHLVAVLRLGKVRAGQVVGRVGNSGDAAGGPTHDHFEWHPGGGPAVDPYAWLNAACRYRPPSRPRTRKPPSPPQPQRLSGPVLAV